MTQGEQRIYYEKALADAIGEYKHVSCLVDAIRICVNDIDFEEKFPVSQERYLLVEKMKASEGVQTNLRNSIRFYRAMLKANKPEPWEENNAIRTVNTPCGPVNLVNQDKVSREELCEMTHHCGLDADMDDACCQVKGVKPAITGESLRNLLGMQVCRCNVPCDVCAIDKRVGACVKLELVGGDCICLAPGHPTPQEDERPVISFDEEESNVMVDIKDKTEAFMNYLNSVVKD